MEAAQRETRPSATYAIPIDERDHLHSLLKAAGGADSETGPYEAWRVRISDQVSQALAILYESGKLVISGNAPAFDDASSIVETVPGATARKQGGKAEMPRESVTPSPQHGPHIGTDEAGKGDFFGPLVTAGVYVDAKSAEILRVLGVRDSKTINDRALRALADEIRHVSDGMTAITLVAPKRYNDLYRQMRSEGKNLNTLLAWTHSRVIEDLIRAGLRPKFILSDQFGDKRYIEQRLLVDTRQSGIPLIQRPRAESDIAVAAASILARDAFLGWLERASKALGVRLPKGASSQVIETAKLLVQRSGREILNDYAKTSFKTMAKVIGPG
jgi:ribonuclease HIII